MIGTLRHHLDKFTVALILLTLFWFAGNLSHIKGKTPEEAVLSIVRNYNNDVVLDHLQVEMISMNTSFPNGVYIQYKVTSLSQTLYEVTVHSFLGLGWQLGNYESIL